MADWYDTGLDDDMRPRLFALADGGQACALATIVAADGGPRPFGSQMVVKERESWGFLSGGCIEADVALHGRAALADGSPRRLVYGRGSPFIDMRLPCGGRLEVLVERVPPGDPAVAELRRLTEARAVARWRSDGVVRRCGPADPSAGAQADFVADILHTPPQRLAVIGWDPFALAIAAAGAALGWAATLIRPAGPEAPPPVDVVYSRLPVPEALAALRPDPWTAVAVATHDLELDHDALVAALNTDAGYVGVLGARRRLPDRLARLREAGLDETALARLRAPIGLHIGAATPREVAVAVTAEIVALRRARAAATVRAAA